MDRHDIPESITAEHVAEMHREDLKIEHLFGCKGMTYWCDEKRRTAFCLIKAPNKQAIQSMHNHAHGDVPHRIIEVDSTIVESFLGRIEDPKKSQKTELNIINDPAFRTIMMISLCQVSFLADDPKSFSRKIGHYNNSILTSTEKFIGRIVKQRSDYFMLSFNSVTNAVHCAQEIYSHFNDTTQYLNTGMQLNIGLHAGIPVTEKESLFEDTIKLAERFCTIIRGKIVLSHEVDELYESENLNRKLNKEYIKALNKGEEKFVDLIMDYTEKEWANTAFNSDNFSKNLGYSKSQVYRKMMALTGKSSNSFIKEYRLDKALQLLKQNTKNISETAFSTGFNSPAYFSKCFMDHFGILPSKYVQSFMG
ncbi:hypothetical protein GCM10007383_00010 [Arenibacter certesii]|uniref:HTH araC/xylS-type domain-containing protein n=2 Tax=Arenibacter certesii TaxID=228955 RepID=A0A918ILX7_9FLAO|nr:hypothetical protein GCM10007383_00010 [Arenibacter certesii]